ncbi:hypothetical protein ABH948_005623 [Bacillus sp. RC218]|uniref:hypothetical protein n=1 Tax=Bacillus sp. RC218 TaxID=3156282 RepID=UPI0038348991
MESKSKSFVVTVTPITESSDLTIKSNQTNGEKKIQTPEKPDQRLVPYLMKRNAQLEEENLLLKKASAILRCPLSLSY